MYDTILVWASIMGLVGAVLWAAGKLIGIDWLFFPAAILLSVWGIVALCNGFVLVYQSFVRAREGK